MNEDTGTERRTHLRRIALGLRLSRFARYYLLVLGCLGLLSCLIGLRFDVSIVVLLLAAGGLWRWHDSARVVAIVICAYQVVTWAAALGWLAVQGTEAIELSGGENFGPVAVILAALGHLVLLSIALVVLLHPATRHAFQAKARLRRMRLQPLKWD